MPELALVRYEHNQYCTFGMLIAPGFTCHTLEPPWADNQRNISCIPPGDYECFFMPKSSSGKYRNVYHVRGVDNRSGILIHAGNTPPHTLGCILPGKSRGMLAGYPAVLNSKSALFELVQLLDRQPIKLKVIDYGMAG